MLRMEQRYNNGTAYIPISQRLMDGYLQKRMTHLFRRELMPLVRFLLILMACIRMQQVRGL